MYSSPPGMTVTAITSFVVLAGQHNCTLALSHVPASPSRVLSLYNRKFPIEAPSDQALLTLHLTTPYHTTPHHSKPHHPTPTPPPPHLTTLHHTLPPCALLHLIATHHATPQHTSPTSRHANPFKPKPSESNPTQVLEMQARLRKNSSSSHGSSVIRIDTLVVQNIDYSDSHHGYMSYLRNKMRKPLDRFNVSCPF